MSQEQELILLGFPDEEIVRVHQVQFYTCRPYPGFIAFVWPSLHGGFSLEVRLDTGQSAVRQFREVADTPNCADALVAKCLIHDFIARFEANYELCKNKEFPCE